MRKTVAVLMLLVLLSGCAVFKEKNRTLTNALDDAVEIESDAAKVAWAPVFIPMGFTSLAIDALILHPAEELPDALEDTYEDLWEDPTGTHVTQVFLFVPKVVVTPVWFAFTWFGRSAFD